MTYNFYNSKYKLTKKEALIKTENLNLAGLKYFLDAVELKSLTLSSAKNNVSRPAISQAIRRLEQWCGYDLLTHDKRLFVLTEKGKNFYYTAKLTYENIEKGFSQKIGIEDTFKVGCSASLVDIVFPAISTKLNKIASPIIKVGTSQQLFKLLEDEEINLGFLIEANLYRNYDYTEIYSGEFEVRSKSGTIENVLITTEGRPEVESFVRYTSQKKIVFKNHIIVESWTSSNRMTEIIESVCLVPGHLPKGKLKSVSLKGWKYPYKVYAVSRKKGLLSKIETEILCYFSKS